MTAQVTAHKKRERRGPHEGKMISQKRRMSHGKRGMKTVFHLFVVRDFLFRELAEKRKGGECPGKPLLTEKPYNSFGLFFSPLSSHPHTDRCDSGDQKAQGDKASQEIAEIIPPSDDPQNAKSCCNNTADNVRHFFPL